MSVVLPKEINYTRPASLPEGTQCNSIVASPINGATFTGGSQIIQFDLVQRGYLVPESMYLRYKFGATLAAAVVTTTIRATPVYTPFSRLETIVGSQVVESIQNYNQLCNMLVNCRMNYAQKVGIASSFGYSSIGTAAVLPPQVATDFAFNLSTSAPNGYSYNTSPAGTYYNFMSAPVGCILSNADNLVPLKFMPSCRIQLTTETIANIFGSSANITNYSLSNIELCYDVIEFNPMVDQAISGMAGGQLTIKSQSYLSSGVTAGAGSVGTLEFLFNQRLASIKSLYLHLSANHANAVNGMFDSLDITGSLLSLPGTTGGDYQFFVGGVPYPPRPMSTILNKSGILSELSESFGPIHDLLTTNFSISPMEFSFGNTATTTQCQMGKFYIGTNVEKLSTNNALLTGISSQGSPISVRISIGTATTNAQTIQLICSYDALLQIDLVGRGLVVLQ